MFNKTLEELSAIASKYRGTKVTCSIDNENRFVAIGDRSYIPGGQSIGTAITDKDDTLVMATLVDNLFLHEIIGRLSHCGFGGYKDSYAIQALLGREF